MRIDTELASCTAARAARAQISDAPIGTLPAWPCANFDREEEVSCTQEVFDLRYWRWR
jgi:hypothetical protein